MKNLLKKLSRISYAIAPVIAFIGIIGAGTHSFPIGHEPKVPEKLRQG